PPGAIGPAVAGDTPDTGGSWAAAGPPPHPVGPALRPGRRAFLVTGSVAVVAGLGRVLGRPRAGPAPHPPRAGPAPPRLPPRPPPARGGGPAPLCAPPPPRPGPRRCRPDRTCISGA